MSAEDLVRGFVARQDLLARLLDDLRRVQPGSPPQHQIVIGQRGLGKTTLLRRLAFAVEDDPQLSATWIPLVFPEEQYNVKNLGDFWLNCVDALSDSLDRTGQERAAEALDEKVARIPTDPDRRSAASLSLLVSEAERLGRGLVLLVDNLDIVLDRLDKQEEWEFRRVISAEPRLYFIGASSRALEALYEHGRALYDYFQAHDLKGLSDPEMFAVLGKLADEAGDDKVRRLLEEKPGRVRALRVLTAGNPRTLMLLYRVLSQGPEGDVERDMEQLLDLYTPLYKARFEEMAPQAQQLVDAMAIHWDPITAGDLAEKMAPMSVNQVSAQLKRLEDFGVVEKAPWFGEKKAAFQIAERFFNIWYLMRASRRVRRRLIWLVKFLEAWFEREELNVQARRYLSRDPKTIGSERYAEMALAYSQTVDDRHLRRNLESAGLQAALDVSVRDLIDFSDLPPEVQDRKARMERLRQLRDRVLGFRFDGVDSGELWRLLGGSPHLLLEEKARTVNDLPTLGKSGAQKLYAKLKRAEELIYRLYREDSADIARLYEALATGEMADVYDIEGALAVASRWGCGWLPLLAIQSRINPALMSDEIAGVELEMAEAALRALTQESEYEAKAWCGLGHLMCFRLYKPEEAEKAYRRAIETDPQFAWAWNALGSLYAFDVIRYEDAEQAYLRAIELSPHNPHPRVNLGDLLQVQLKRYPEAEQAYLGAIECDPQCVSAWYGLAILLTETLERHEEAAASYRRAIELDPQISDTWNRLGVLLHDNLQQYDEAEIAYRRAIDIDPTSPYPWGNLARLLELDIDRQTEALNAYFRVTELDPTDDWRRQEALRIARATGASQPKVELHAVSRLHESMPQDQQISFVLAGLLALNDNWDQARQLFSELASAETEQPDIWAFSAALEAGHLDDLLAILEATSAKDLWRPLYEALCAVRAGSAQYLRRVAPEIRPVAQAILDELAPGLPG